MLAFAAVASFVHHSSGFAASGFAADLFAGLVRPLEEGLGVPGGFTADLPLLGFPGDLLLAGGLALDDLVLPTGFLDEDLPLGVDGFAAFPMLLKNAD